MEIALLGDRFDAQTAKDIGMINFVVPTEELEDVQEKCVSYIYEEDWEEDAQFDKKKATLKEWILAKYGGL